VSEEWKQALAEAVAEHEARARKHANFFDGLDKEVKHHGIAKEFCENLNRQHGIAYSIRTDAQLDPSLPPDVALKDAHGRTVGVEITELVNRAAIDAQIQGRDDYFAISFEFGAHEAVAFLHEVVVRKELAAVNVCSQYADFLLLIHCAEPWLSRDALASAIAAHAWPVTRGIRAAYLMFDYMPMDPYRIVRIF